MAESRVVRCGSEDAIVPSERLSILPFIAIGSMSAMHSRVWVLNEKVNWCLVIVKQAIDRKVVVMVASTMKENVIMMEWIIERRGMWIIERRGMWIIVMKKRWIIVVKRRGIHAMTEGHILMIPIFTKKGVE